MAKQGGRIRKPSLAGTNLSCDTRNGLYVWRRTDERTGRRIKKSTKTHDLKIALRRAQTFEEDYQKSLVGLSKFEGYRRSLIQFIDPFIDSLESATRRRIQLRSQLDRAFKLLGLKQLADIEDFMRLEKKLLKLEGIFSQKTLARSFQAPLKQFTKYLAGRREIPIDHLAAWPLIKQGEKTRTRRAITPDEMARILAACDSLDDLLGRENRSRPIWTALLVTASRISAFSALNVQDLDPRKRKIHFKGNQIKKAGAGSLDEGTLDELMAYLNSRTDGPLFLSPSGNRLYPLRSLSQWRSAASLAFVDMDWPSDEPHDLWEEYLVHLTLFKGKVQVALGGPRSGPNQPGQEKLLIRETKEKKVSCLAERIRKKWEKRMRGIDQHCLRMTHRTWALAAGVPEILIDQQLGHSSPAGEAALQAIWSTVGRTHYTDYSFLSADARKSAEAVRQMLDKAEGMLQDIADQGKTALASSSKTRMVGLA